MSKKLFAVVFGLCCGAAFALSSSGCLNTCQAELSACLKDGHSSKTMCYAEYRACKAECSAQ